MKPTLDIRDIPISEIEANPENPNEMNDDILAALRDDISRRGFVQPILVRPIESADPKVHFRLVDGEHRWKVMGELGAETIPCVVTDEDATDADIRMLTMNRLRGQMVPIRLAHLLADLSERVEPQELTKRIGMEPAELKDLLDLAGVDEQPAPEPEPEPEPDEPDEPEATITVVATAAQAKTLRALLADDESEQATTIARAAQVVAYNVSDEHRAPTTDS